MSERVARHQLGDQDGAPVALAELVERDDRRVVEPRRGLRLAQHPGGVERVDLLERDLALEPLVEGPVDGAHAPGADPLDHPKATHHQLFCHDLHRSPVGGPLLPRADRPVLAGAVFILWPAESDLGATVAFLDEDDLQPAGSGSGPRRGAPERQRQLMTRRVIAVGIGVLIVILLLLGVKGCLNARKERGFENYVSDLSSIATQSNQLSSEFFARLENPPKNADELSLEAQIASDRGTAEALLQRVENLDTPDELERRARPSSCRRSSCAATPSRGSPTTSPPRSATRAAARRSTGSPATCAPSSPATSCTPAPSPPSSRGSPTRTSAGRCPTASSCPSRSTAGSTTCSSPRS